MDLSVTVQKIYCSTEVPVREDGVDLSTGAASRRITKKCPRPRGRGGFKQIDYNNFSFVMEVPVREDGVDLSVCCWSETHLQKCPRPRGRGGFKLHKSQKVRRALVPVREDGVDLSLLHQSQVVSKIVPVREDGVDLSICGISQ